MYLSKVTPADWKYEQTEPIASGHLDVHSEGHQIYWAEYGNPDGEPVMCVHGGPGGGSDAYMARFFAPRRYRVLVFDQRGCGKSRPSASDDDARPALRANTTADLIEDMNKLREHRGITSKMHLFGGSWGSTLSLAYAIAHPEHVSRLILRGIFLCRKKDLDFFYQGNAAVYEQDPLDTSLPGSYQLYPEAWEEYVRVIPPKERHDMIRAYDAVFSREPRNDADLQYQIRAAQAWAGWEGRTSYLSLDASKSNDYEEAKFAKAFARIENYYFINGSFLGGTGEVNRQQNYILAHVERLKGIPIHIVHGRYDMVCPMFQAEELVAALRQVGHTDVDYRRTPAGHSMLERENCQVLTDILDHLPSPGTV